MIVEASDEMRLDRGSIPLISIFTMKKALSFQGFFYLPKNRYQKEDDSSGVPTKEIMVFLIESVYMIIDNFDISKSAISLVCYYRWCFSRTNCLKFCTAGGR